MAAAPYIFDGNRRVVDNGMRVIKPAEPQDNDANEVLLGDAMDKAKLLRDDAMVKAAEIISKAELDAENIRQSAYQEGYDKGLEEGNMEAMRRADEYLENVRRELGHSEEQLRIDMQSALKESENKLVDLSCNLIERITGMLIAEYKPVLLHMINEALKEADASKKFIIKVSEENYSYVSDNEDRLFGAANPGISIEIYGDSSMRNDQCVIESENGIIDLSMDVQIKNLVTAIKLLSC